MKKHIATDGHGNAVESIVKVKRKPPAPYVQAEWITDYMKARDKCIFIKTDCNETRLSILTRWVTDKVKLEELKLKYNL